MARGGITLTDVSKARRALLARGHHPSIDAIRAELGHTGSKTTISRLLEDIKAQEVPLTRAKLSVSETLEELIEQLASQLHEEAQAGIDTHEAQFQAREQGLTQQLESLKAALTAAEKRIDQGRVDFELCDQRRGQLEQSREEQAVAIGRLEQQLASQQDILRERDRHIQSLEDDHRHAREALEHYRTSVKEQREQDQRHHDQQIQPLQMEIRELRQTLAVKQNEITRLSSDTARHSAEANEQRKQFQALERERHSLEVKCQTLTTALTSIRSELTQTVAQEQNHQAESTRLSRMLETASAEVQTVKTRLVEVEAELAVKSALLDKWMMGFPKA